MLRRGIVSLALGVAGAGLLAGTAQAATIASPAAVDRSCTARLLTTGAGFVHRTVAAAGAGSVTARLDGGAGDWDLAVFDTLTGRLVAGSAYRGSRELAAGYVPAAGTLTVQACRVSGGAGTANLTISTQGLPAVSAEPSSMVRVATPTRARAQQLANSGLDVTEHGGAGFLDVVLHGAADARKLRDAGFQYVTQVPDLTVQSRRDRKADAAFAAANAASELPSGQSTYRRLFDYSEALKRLAREHPDLVKPITLNHTTYEGRPVEGIEITTNPNARDGKPVFLQMGAHHAREWPSAEHAMEWAYELILGYRRGDAQTKRLVETTRTIVVPVVNPDGFNASREAGELLGAGDGRGGSADDETVNILSHPNEYRRKNCRMLDGSASGNCLQPAFGLASAGVDPNRNYGGFWGGPGASGDPTNETYWGTGPFSEPETQNVRELISVAPGDDADHQPHLLEPRAAPARAPGPGADAGRADLQGARRRDGGRERLRQPALVPALRHHRHDRGLELLLDGRPRLHVRDRAGALPPALRGDGGRVRGRQPGRVLPRAGEHGRREQARGAGRAGPGGRGPAAEEDVPDPDVTGHDVLRHARQHDAGAVQRPLRVARRTSRRVRWSRRSAAARRPATRARRSRSRRAGSRRRARTSTTRRRRATRTT